MKTKSSTLLILFLLLLQSSGWGQSSSGIVSKPKLATKEPRPNEEFARQANDNISFIENTGDIFSNKNLNITNAKYYGKSNGVEFYLKQTGITYLFTRLKKPISSNPSKMIQDLQNAEMVYNKVDVKLIGANMNASITSEDQAQQVYNFFGTGGHDQLSVKAYNKIIYHDIYPHIDMVLYHLEGNLKYDFIVHPGGDPNAIKMKFDGQDKISLDKAGDLTIANKLGDIKETAPFTYQNKAIGEKQKIGSNFALKNGVLSFKAKAYDHNKDLIIDPTRLWGTYYGVSSASETNSAGVCVDGSYIYIVGYAIVSGNFKAYVQNFNTSGGTGGWVNYVGNDHTYGLAVTSDANKIYITGYTSATTGVATSGAHQTSMGGNSDAFIAGFPKPGASGTPWVTYYGGTGFEAGRAIVSDGTSIYVTGETSSSSQIATSGTIQSTIASGAGGYDAYVAKFSSSGSRTWGTYFGGTNDDLSYAITFDATNNHVIIGGATKSNSLCPGSCYQSSVAGGFDAFIKRIDYGGASSGSFTYYGGTGDDYIYALGIDGNGYVTAAGQSNSSSSISNQNTINGGIDGFLARFSPNFSVRDFGAYVGSNNDDWLNGIAIDGSNLMYVSGTCAGQLSNAPSCAYRLTSTVGGTDAILGVFAYASSTFTTNYLTQYGDISADVGSGVALDGSGNIYLAGTTGSSSGISTLSSPTYSGTYMAYLVQWGACSVTTPTIAQGSTAYICGAGNTTVYLSTSATGCSYKWYKDNGSGYVVIPGATSSSYTPTAAANYKVEITQNGTCCIATSAACTVSIMPAPVLTPSSACVPNGSSTTFSAYSSLASSYELDDASNTLITTSSSGSFTQTITGDVTFHVRSRDASGCNSSNYAVFTASMSPGITEGLSITACPNSNTLLHGTGGFSTYYWYNSSHTYITSGSSFSAASGAEYSTTTYYVKGVTGGTPSCETMVTITSSTGPSITASTASPVYFCTGTSPGLSVTFASSSAGPWSVKWTHGSSSVCNTVSSPGTYTYTPTWTVVNGDVVTVTISEGCTSCGSGCTGCSVSKSFTYNDVTPLTTITASQVLCPGSSLSVTAPTGQTYKWYKDGTAITGWVSTNSVTATSTGDYYYQTYNSFAACTLTSTHCILSAPGPLTITASSCMLGGGTSSITLSAASGYSCYGSTYNWYTYPPGGSSLGTGAGLVVTSPGDYFMTVTSSTGVVTYSNIIHVYGACGAITNPTFTGTSWAISGGTTSITGIIDVTNGVTLTIGSTSSYTVLAMDACSQIIVEPGGHLVIQNTRITTCGNAWQGIKVKGDPTGVLPNGTAHIAGTNILHAICAVYSIDGGDVTLDATASINLFDMNTCNLAVVFGSASTGPSISLLGPNQFGTLQDFSTCSTCSLPFTPKSTGFGRSVYLDGVSYINLFGILFRPLTTMTTNDCGVEAWNCSAINISGNQFSGPMHYGIYMNTTSGTSSSGHTVSGNTFGSSTGGIGITTGLFMKNIQSSTVGSSVAPNSFYYLTNGIEYYSNLSGTPGLNTVTKNLFSNNTFGFVGASDVYPVTGTTSGTSGNSNTPLLNVAISCNEFTLNKVGIIGSGNLAPQLASSTDAGNFFHRPSTNNADWDILWQNGTNITYNYGFYLQPNSSAGGLSLISTYIINYVVQISSNVNFMYVGTSSCYVGPPDGPTAGPFISGIQSQGSDSKVISVYPNPSTSTFIVNIPDKGSAQTYTMEIWDILGKKIDSRTISGTLTTIDANAWSAGAYYLTITDVSGHLFSTQLIKIK